MGLFYFLFFSKKVFMWTFFFFFVFIEFTASFLFYVFGFLCEACGMPTPPPQLAIKSAPPVLGDES